MTEAGSWSRESRWLHAGIAFGVTWQLFSSLWMTPSWAKAEYNSLGGILFSLHAWVGLMTALFILWHWLWLASDAGARRQLFPWRGPWAQVLAEAKGLLQGSLPPTGPHGGLVGLVHGLGLLAVTWMGLTGAAIFFFLPQGGTSPGATLHSLVPLHTLLANIVWAYWIGHVSMVALHVLRRDRIWNIFRLWE